VESTFTTLTIIRKGGENGVILVWKIGVNLMWINKKTGGIKNETSSFIKHNKRDD